MRSSFRAFPARMRFSVVLAQARVIHYEFHGLLVRHVEAKVAAEHDPVGPDEPYQVVQGRMRMRNRVIVESAQVGIRRRLEMPALGTNAPAMGYSPDQIGQRPLRRAEGKMPDPENGRELRRK